MNIPQVDIGKAPEAQMHVSLLFWLPPNSPFGNLQLKHLKILTRLDRANALIKTIYQKYPLPINSITPNGNQFLNDCNFLIEEIIFHLRRAADEMIGLCDLLNSYERENGFSDVINMDSIGKLLSNEKTKNTPPFVNHLQSLELLNEISNAFKHSFVLSDLNLIGEQEPVVYALSVKQNKLKTGIKFHNVKLSNIIEAYNSFFLEINSWLRSNSGRCK